jgi:AraC-like DNA-binding protein
MNLVPHRNSLPSLLFGDRIAVVDRTADAVAQRIAPVLPLRVSYKPIGLEADFVHRSRVVRINDLELMGASTTPLEVDARQSNTPLLVIPVHGVFKASINACDYECRAGQSACLLPATPWRIQTEITSVLVISINQERMQRLTQEMFGRPHGTDHPFEWHRPHLLALHAGGLAFERMFNHVGNMLDSLIEKPELLAKSGLDDMIYRIVAMMLQPELFTEPGADLKKSGNGQPAPLAVACDYIRDNLEKRIGLSDLEQVSGMSARNLQYLFQKQFGCSPMRWLTQQRLESGRKQLINAESRTKITNIASALRFSNLGNFSKLYQAQFGELPSETLARSKKNP